MRKKTVKASVNALIRDPKFNMQLEDALHLSELMKALRDYKQSESLQEAESVANRIKERYYQTLANMFAVMRAFVKQSEDAIVHFDYSRERCGISGVLRRTQILTLTVHFADPYVVPDGIAANEDRVNQRFLYLSRLINNAGKRPLRSLKKEKALVFKLKHKKKESQTNDVHSA